ncbi:metal-dependent phosphohydrolase [Acholeplasma sp. OttesenSCG-928-E16]|nr:metal-dependent phosphohydrolase [Acholeplasma sp. OttesenSCG-928-E16]
MDRVEGKQYFIVGKIEGINKGANFKNITVLLENEERVNLKTDDYAKNGLYIGKIFQFEVLGIKKNDSNDIILKLINAVPIEEIYDGKKLEDIMTVFYRYAPLSLTDMEKKIEACIKGINNKVLKEITDLIYQKNKNKFFTHPGGTKFHHAYVGGLAYHTLCMLKLTKPIVVAYPYLNADLLNAGIILHDMGKINEMTGVDGEYTTEGQLIGHLVMGAIDIDEAAIILGHQETEEALLLKHMMISHHGQYNFGSPKKPMVGEALMLWYIDSIDSKFTVLGDELMGIEEGEWTAPVAALDKLKFYKSKVKK